MGSIQDPCKTPSARSAVAREARFFIELFYKNVMIVLPIEQMNTIDLFFKASLLTIFISLFLLNLGSFAEGKIVYIPHYRSMTLSNVTTGTL